MDLLLLAQPAAVDVFPIRLRPDLAHHLISGRASAFSTEGAVDESVDYKAHFYANHRAFFTLFALFTPVDFVDTLLKGIPHFLQLGPQYIVSNLLYFGGLTPTLWHPGGSRHSLLRSRKRCISARISSRMANISARNESRRSAASSFLPATFSAAAMLVCR